MLIPYIHLYLLNLPAIDGPLKPGKPKSACQGITINYALA